MNVIGPSYQAVSNVDRLFDRSKTDQCVLQEGLRITLPLSDDIVSIALVRLVEPKPHATKVELLDEAFTNVLPVRIVTVGADSAESGPVRLVEENLKTRLLVQLPRDDIENDNAGFCHANQRLCPRAIGQYY